jgi:hypothetical protein
VVSDPHDADRPAGAALAGVPFAPVCGGLAAISYPLWRSRARVTTHRPAVPAVTRSADTGTDALAKADARVLAESETAERTRDDRPYADAIARLHEVVTRHPDVPGGTFLLHGHRAEYPTFQAGITSERLEHAPAERRKPEDRMHKLYDNTEAELRAAIAAPPGTGRSAAREYVALGLLLCVGAEQPGTDRTAEGVRLLREASSAIRRWRRRSGPRSSSTWQPPWSSGDRLNNTTADRHDAEALLTVLTRPDSPVAELAARVRTP